jgi:hypothetical protein
MERYQSSVFVLFALAFASIYSGFFVPADKVVRIFQRLGCKHIAPSFSGVYCHFKISFPVCCSVEYFL